MSYNEMKTEKSVFNTIKDKAGFVFKNCFFNKGGEAVICVGGKNRAFKGTPKIVARDGDSVYGEQILISFLIKKEIDNYKPKSPYDVIEIYFPQKEGLDFLKKSISFIEENGKQKKLGEI